MTNKITSYERKPTIENGKEETEQIKRNEQSVQYIAYV